MRSVFLGAWLGALAPLAMADPSPAVDGGGALPPPSATAPPSAVPDSPPIPLHPLQALRSMDLTASSAFEEACARLQETLPTVPPPRPGEPRDLRTALPWPASIDPEHVREDAKLDGLEVSRVKIRSGPWMLQSEPSDVPRHLSTLECGMLELEVTIGYTTPSGKILRTAIARRYASAPPSSTADEVCRILIQSHNSMFRVDGATETPPAGADPDPITGLLAGAELIRRDVACMLYSEPKRDLGIFDNGRGLSVRIPKSLGPDFWKNEYSPSTYRLIKIAGPGPERHRLQREDSQGRSFVPGCLLTDMLVNFDPNNGAGRKHFLEITLLGPATSGVSDKPVLTMVLPITTSQPPPTYEVPDPR